MKERREGGKGELGALGMNGQMDNRLIDGYSKVYQSLKNSEYRRRSNYASL